MVLTIFPALFPFYSPSPEKTLFLLVLLLSKMTFFKFGGILSGTASVLALLLMVPQFLWDVILLYTIISVVSSHPLMKGADKTTPLSLRRGSIRAPNAVFTIEPFFFSSSYSLHVTLKEISLPAYSLPLHTFQTPPGSIEQRFEIFSAGSQRDRIRMRASDRKTLENESLNEDTKREKQRRTFFLHLVPFIKIWITFL